MPGIRQLQPVQRPLPARFTALARLVGNTPLLALECTVDGAPRTIYAKAEHQNLTGSIKDRLALHVLRRAYADGRIREGDPVAEASSGNTGISFAALGAALGHPVTIFMPSWMSRERRDLIASFGAQVIAVSPEEGGFLGSIRMSEELARRDARVFLPAQFSNDDNVEAHALATGPEIWAQLALDGMQPDAFVAGVGTGGTVMGVGRYLTARRPAISVHPVEPAESPTLSTGYCVGRHRIQGISDEFIPPIVSLRSLDHVVAVHDGDAIILAQKLARELGLGVGISSGANVVGALLVQRSLGPGAVVATVLADSNKKYLTTDLLKDEPAKSDYFAPRVRFTGYRVLPRLCGLCSEMDTMALNSQLSR